MPTASVTHAPRPPRARRRYRVCRMLLTDTDWRRADRPRRRVGRGVEAHDTIGSTNDRARELLDEPDGEGRAVVAEEQTAGRGRRGRSWQSPPGRNLTVSVALRPRLAAGVAWQLAVAAGLAAPDRLRAARRRRPEVAERPRVRRRRASSAACWSRRRSTAIASPRRWSGIGINVNWRRAEMPPEIADGATSLADLAGAADRSRDAARAHSSTSSTRSSSRSRRVARRWRATATRCATLGSEVAVETSTGRLTGRAIDVDPHGALVVDTGSGLVALATGEVVRLRPGAPA